MSKELKVRVRWSRGAILPVLTKGSATGAELSRLLRFACSPNDEVVLVHHGVPLNPELTLDSQLVKENDIFEAYIMRKTNNSSCDELESKIHSIVFEAARVADRHFDAIENASSSSNSNSNASRGNGLRSSSGQEQKKKSSSDDDYFDLFNEELTGDRNRAGPNAVMTAEPLPTFWKETRQETLNVLDKYVPTKVNSIEEAGQFLEKQGWSSWMW